MTGGARTALLQVANSFLEQNRPLQAIKCLEAIRLSSRTDFPEAEAELLLKLGTLLLEHTHDVKQANVRLQEAHAVLRGIREAFSLKCAVLSALASCCQATGDHKQLRDVCTKGLETCRKGGKSLESEELRVWHVHFLTTLAACPSTGKDTSKALGHLHEALEIMPDNPELQMLLRLGIAQLHADGSDLEATRQALVLAEEGLQALGGSPEGIQANLRLHYRLLWVCYHLQLGDIETLSRSKDGKKGGLPEFVEEVQTTSEATGKSSASYQWLPAGVLPALACVAAASIWRPVGKFGHAKTLLESAMVHLQGAKRAAGLDSFDEEGEAGLSPQQRLQALQIAGAEVLVTETLAIIALTKTELQQAGHFICQLMGLCTRWPSLVPRLVPCIHLLAGHYCRKMGHPDEATAHFLAASRLARRQVTKQLAAMEAALCMVEEGGEAGAVRAIELLKQEGLYDKPAENMGHLASAVHEYLSGRLMSVQGESKKGSLLMMKAMKTAHLPLKNHQLVANVMLALLPHMEAEQDALKTMANTTISLSKNIYDLPTQIEGNEQMLAWMKKNKEEQGGIAKQQAYIARKQDSLQEVTQLALGKKDQHAKLLNWSPRGGRRS